MPSSPCHAERSEASLRAGGQKFLYVVQADNWPRVVALPMPIVSLISLDLSLAIARIVPVQCRHLLEGWRTMTFEQA